MRRSQPYELSNGQKYEGMNVGVGEGMMVWVRV